MSTKQVRLDSLIFPVVGSQVGFPEQPGIRVNIFLHDRPICSTCLIEGSAIRSPDALVLNGMLEY